MSSSPAVSIIIPTFNGAKLLKAHLSSVLDCARTGDEIIVVDDASRDETAKWLVDKFTLKREPHFKDFEVWRAKVTHHAKKLELVLVFNPRNLRFGGSCNRGVQVAHHPIVFLVNNDVSPTAGVIEAALPHFADEQVFAVGCHEIEKNLGGISGGKNKLWFERGMFVHSRADDFSTGETGWASGGSAFFDRKKWQELGGFDSAYYPAYWEDIDLSYRAKRQGWKVLFEAQAVVFHNHETTHSNVFGQRSMRITSFKNAIEFIWRNGTMAQKLQHLLWLPYHLIFTSLRTQGAFLRGFVQFLYR